MPSDPLADLRPHAYLACATCGGRLAPTRQGMCHVRWLDGSWTVYGARERDHRPYPETAPEACRCCGTATPGLRFGRCLPCRGHGSVCNVETAETRARARRLQELKPGRSTPSPAVRRAVQGLEQ